MEQNKSQVDEKVLHEGPLVTISIKDLHKSYGKKEVLKVKLTEDVVDPDDIEMLEDLIVAATNEALRKIDDASQQSMSKITGGLGGF